MLRGILREKKDFSTESCTGIGMKASKWKNGFIKNHNAGNINSSGGDIKTLIAFVHVTITNKSILFGTKFKFPFVIRTEIWPNSTPKSAEEGELGFSWKRRSMGVSSSITLLGIQLIR
jgi:hypothetical protein